MKWLFTTTHFYRFDVKHPQATNLRVIKKIKRTNNKRNMNDEQDDQVRFDEQRSAQYVQYDIDDDIQ